MASTVVSVNTQEYDNPAYLEDTPGVAVDSPDGDSVAPSPTEDNYKNMTSLSHMDEHGVSMVTMASGLHEKGLTPPTNDKGRRRSSIADVALAMNPSLTSSSRHSSVLSLMELAGPNYFTRGNYFRHPFGNTTSIIEELFPLEEEIVAKPVPGEKREGQSPAKLVIWIVFTLFMVAVAGGIILGAESFEQSPRADNSNYTDFNDTQTSTKPG